MGESWSYSEIHKLFCLVVTFGTMIAYMPLEVFSDGRLQEMADIVKHMNTTRLCNHDCKPVVKICGSNLTLSYETSTTCDEDTDALCKCMYDYLKLAVGDATYKCNVTKNQVAIVFHGKYYPNKNPQPPLTTLANVLSRYEKPDLGGYKSSHVMLKKDGRIYMKMTYSGKNYQSACDGILKYLNQNNFLSGASNNCTEKANCEKAVLNIWANE